MVYATVEDMVDRYGQVELIRLTTPADEDMETVRRDPIERALTEASALIDTYLRKRYRVPTDIAPDEVRRAACVLARYDLYTGEQREPTEQVRLARKETLEWLKLVADGEALLDLEDITAGDSSFAQVSVRGQDFGVPIPGSVWNV